MILPIVEMSLQTNRLITDLSDPALGSIVPFLPTKNGKWKQAVERQAEKEATEKKKDRKTRMRR